MACTEKLSFLKEEFGTILSCLPPKNAAKRSFKPSPETIHSHVNSLVTVFWKYLNIRLELLTLAKTEKQIRLILPHKTKIYGQKYMK